MPKLYISNQYYQAMPTQAQKVPRERFIRYYNDLFDLEGMAKPEMSAYLRGSQYSFSELGDVVLTSAQEVEDFSKLDLFTVAYWGHEFDPDSSFGAYFASRYNITSTMFDVCDQGILSSISAINLIMAYAKAGKIKNAALLCFDQRSIPVEVSFAGAFPVKNSARLLFFSTEKSEASNYQLLRVCINNHQQKTTNHKNHTGQTIMIEPGSPYYSSAEIFSVLFEQVSESQPLRDLHINVIDAESSWQGLISFRRTL